MRGIVAFLALLSLAACGPKIQLVRGTHEVQQTGHRPELGIEASAPVGGVVFSQFDYLKIVGFKTVGSLTMPLRFPLKAVVPAGTRLTQVVIDGVGGYCTESITVYTADGAAIGPSCFVDTDGDSRFDIEAAHDRELPVPMAFERFEDVGAAKGFKYELLYNGCSDDVLHLSYREYVDNMARPAYFQDVTYAYRNEGPTQIAFRGVRIEVLSADNTAIRYRVVSTFQ